jgi:hypothetical protein
LNCLGEISRGLEKAEHKGPGAVLLSGRKYKGTSTSRGGNLYQYCA